MGVEGVINKIGKWKGQRRDIVALVSCYSLTVFTFNLDTFPNLLAHELDLLLSLIPSPIQCFHVTSPNFGKPSIHGKSAAREATKKAQNSINQKRYR